MLTEKCSGWIVSKILDFIKKKCTNNYEEYKIKAVAESALQNALNKALSRQPALSEDVLTKTFQQDIFGSIFEKMLETASRIDADSLLNEFEKVFIERWKKESNDDPFQRIYRISKDEALEFMRVFLRELESEFRKKTELRAIARDVSIFDTHDQVLEIHSMLKRALPELNKTPEELLLEFREKSKIDIDKFILSKKSPTALVCLGLHDNSSKDFLSHEQLIEKLSKKQNIILKAEPGAGKTTTLLQLATTILGQSTHSLPIYIPLQNLGLKDIFDEIAGRSSFIGGKETLIALAKSGCLILFCDGWNEVRSEQRETVLMRIEEFSRDYNNNAIVVATRSNTALPSLSDSLTVSILPLTRIQQIEIIQAQLGDKGVKLLEKARKTQGLRDIIRTPFYLSALAAIDGSGSFPETKEQIISNFISKHIETGIHSRTLSNALNNCQKYYLSSLAENLVWSGSNSILVEGLRIIFSQVADKLNHKRQIYNIPDLDMIISTLVNHHILVQEGDGIQAIYSFQHQQFEEWYASFYAEQAISNILSTKKDIEVLPCEQIVNRVNWEEPILFAAERLSRTSDEGVNAVSILILRTLGIDPMFAANLILRASEPAWEAIKGKVTEFINIWHKEGEADRAFSFMLATGKNDFSPQVWTVIETYEKQQGGAFHLRRSGVGRFNPMVLGVNSKERLLKLKLESRRALYWDIASDGGQEGIDFVAEAVKSEPDAGIIVEVIDMLDFRDAESNINELLEHLSGRDDVWVNLATRGRELESSIDDRFVERIYKERRKQIEIFPAGYRRILGLLESGAESDSEYARNIVYEALSTKFEDYHAENGAYDAIAKIYPTMLSEILVIKVLDGIKIPYSALGKIIPSNSYDQTKLLETAINSSDERIKSVLSKLLNIESVSKVLDGCLVALDKWLESDRNHVLGKHYQAYHDILINSNLRILIDVISKQKPTNPHHIGELARIISYWRDNDRDTKTLPVQGKELEGLVILAENWVKQLLAHNETTRGNLNNVAAFIGRLGIPNLLPFLELLLEKELELWNGCRKTAQEYWSQNKQPPEPVLSESCFYRLNQYKWAFDGFNCPELPPILLKYIENPEFDTEAALALLHFYKSGETEKILHYPDFSQVLEKRSLISITKKSEAHQFAQAITNRINVLLKLSDKISIEHAVKLGIVVAQMNYGNSIDVFNHLLSLDGYLSERAKIVQLLILNGEIISSDVISRGLTEAMSVVFNDKWNSQDKWYQIEEWLELLTFTDNTQAIIETLTKLPDDYRTPRRFSRVLKALSCTTPTIAVDILSQILNIVPSIVSDYNYFTAVSRIGSEGAAMLLLNIIFDISKVEAVKREHCQFSRAFAPLLRTNKAVINELFQRLSDEHSLTTRQMVAYILPEFVDTESFMILLSMIKDDNDPFYRELPRIVEKLVIKDVPLENGSNAYTRCPCDVTELREKLFSIACDTENNLSEIAVSILKQIDSLRDEYGHVITEPRHPNLSLGVPWPFEAKLVL